MTKAHNAASERSKPSSPQIWASFVDPNLAPTALRVALTVGTILFCINHGTAVLEGNMRRARWISAALTYVVPYSVSIHGQHTSRSRRAAD